MGCKLECTGLWEPQERGIIDTAIMDDIRNEKELRRDTTIHLHPLALWHVNACRLYLKVTMKSDIVNSDGTEILHWVMEGTQQSKKNQNYPYQPKPPKESWNIWRNSIHATYLGRNRTKNDEYEPSYMVNSVD